MIVSLHPYTPVLVHKQTAAIDANPSPAKITYNQQCSKSALGGGQAKNTDKEVVTGIFRWAEVAGKSHPKAGTHDASLVFVPDDKDNYNDTHFVHKASLVVERQTPRVSVVPTAGAIHYGKRLCQSSLFNGKAVQVDIKVDPGLKALVFQPVESTSLSKLWFWMSTCTSTVRQWQSEQHQRWSKHDKEVLELRQTQLTQARRR